MLKSLFTALLLNPKTLTSSPITLGLEAARAGNNVKLPEIKEEPTTPVADKRPNNPVGATLEAAAPAISGVNFSHISFSNNSIKDKRYSLLSFNTFVSFLIIVSVFT